MMMMQAATSSTPVMEISESDGNWIMRTSTTLKKIELKFRYTNGYKSRLCPKINFILRWLYVAVLLYCPATISLLA
jgi:hypothetical protein